MNDTIYEVIIKKLNYEQNYIKVDYEIVNKAKNSEIKHRSSYINISNFFAHKVLPNLSEIKISIKESIEFVIGKFIKESYEVIDFDSYVDQIAFATIHWLETHRQLNSYMITALMPREIHKNHGEEIKIIK